MSSDWLNWTVYLLRIIIIIIVAYFHLLSSYIKFSRETTPILVIHVVCLFVFRFVRWCLHAYKLHFRHGPWCAVASAYANHEMRIFVWIPGVLGIIGPIFIPIAHMLVLFWYWQSYARFVDRRFCSCSCWDTVRSSSDEPLSNIGSRNEKYGGAFSRMSVVKCHSS